MRILFFLILAGTAIEAFSQSDVRPLPMNINRPSLNLYAPFISGDGETLVYLSDYTDDGHHSMYWTTREGVGEWADGKEINRLINRPSLNFRGGFSLSFDGDLLLFTSRKSGIGGFDLWYSERNGNDWSAPRNFGKPVNSTSHDGSPSLSPDGNELYFMRCESMSEYGGADGCRLMVARKALRGWKEPEELPANLNTGNSQTPRILADNQTLIFSSNVMGGKGELDLFMSRKTASGWTDPVPLTFINTPYNDAFVSVPSKGRYMYESVKGERDFQLVERLIPETLRPARVMRIRGQVTHNGSPVTEASLVVFDVEKRSRLYKYDVNAGGEFSFVLPEGSSYDVAVASSDPSLTYFSKSYLLHTIGRRDKESLNIALSKLGPGIMLSSALHFDPHSAGLDNASDYEIRRLARLLTAQPGLQLGMEIIQPVYREDSIKSSPDLTEARIDTLWTPPADSLLADPRENDTLRLAGMDTDSVYFMSQTDSIQITYPASYLTILTTYHNDRTAEQAAGILRALHEKGVDTTAIRWKPVLIPYEKEALADDKDQLALEKNEGQKPSPEDRPDEVRIIIHKISREEP